MGMGMGVRALLHLLLLPLIKFPFKQQRNLQREVIALIIAHEWIKVELKFALKHCGKIKWTLNTLRLMVRKLKRFRIT